MNADQHVLLLTRDERDLILHNLPLPPGMLARFRFAVYKDKMLRVDLGSDAMGDFLLLMAESLSDNVDPTYLDAINAVIDRNVPAEVLEDRGNQDEILLSLFPSLSPSELIEKMREIVEGEYSPEAADAALQAFVQEHNNTPQEQLAGLTPTQMRRISSVDWASPDSPIQLATDLSEEDLQGSDMARNGMYFLSMIAEVGTIPLTGKGNLNRKTILKLAADTTWQRFDLAEDLRFYPQPNEINLFAIHLLRVYLEMAGLIKLRTGKLTLTAEGAVIERKRRFGDLQIRMFTVMCDEFNLGYLDGLPDYPAISDCYPFTLYALSQFAVEMTPVEELTQRVFLDVVLQSFDLDTRTPHEEIAIHTRVINPLQDFGLLAVSTSAPPSLPWYEVDVDVQVTPLFHKMFRFSL